MFLEGLHDYGDESPIHKMNESTGFPNNNTMISGRVWSVDWLEAKRMPSLPSKTSLGAKEPTAQPYSSPGYAQLTFKPSSTGAVSFSSSEDRITSGTSG